MEKERPNRQTKSSKEGYIIVTNYFLKKWVKVLGVGPVVLYQELLTYCHKEKYIAWPTINSLCQQMGIAKTTLLRYQNTLIKFGLIKNITRGKSTTGHYRNNIYKIISLEELSKHPDPDKIIDFVGSKMKPDWYQNDTCIGSNMKLSMVSNRYPNNNNLKQYQGNNKEREDAAVAVVNFKKLKEEGEERMLVTRERMVELDFKEEFIEKILKEYSTKKIDEKLDLLLIKRNIQSPVGWLSAALKNDYQDAEQERYDEEPLEQVSRQTPLSHLNSTPSMGKKFRETIVIDSHLSPEDRKIQSRERVLKMIRKTRKMLANLKTKGGTNV
ncbi:hypothetical protein ES704_02402 [subsurface metagenome]|jgi:predicted transcriptional regulator